MSLKEQAAPSTLRSAGSSEMAAVVQDLQEFTERHSRAERREVFRLLQQPPFSPLHADLHMHVQQANVWTRTCRVASLGMLDLLKCQWPTRQQNEHLWARLESLMMRDMSLATLIGAQMGLCACAIITMGSEEQRDEFVNDIVDCKYRGCFAMTELGHGSNVRDIETTATYDVTRKEFVINTPSNSAQKFWIGGGVDAHIAVVMAQLHTRGECHGVHGFIVMMRDSDGHLHDGVRVADVGHKIGLNGVPNARLWFNNVRVPANSLLNRYGSVDEDGSYSSFVADSNLRFSLCLAELLRGRIAIICAAVSISKLSVATAIRYGLTRRQFRVGSQEETLLMDYPMHQRRLLPYLAMAYALQCACHRVQQFWNNRSEEITARMQQMKEIHVVSSGYKAIGGWFARDAIQASREACGGQGYASWNQIGPFRADFDASLTYEGDNCVLLAQTTRQIIKMYRKGLKKGKFPSDGLMFHWNGLLGGANALGLPYPSMWKETSAGVATNVDVSAMFNATLLCHPVYILSCLQAREKFYLELLSQRLTAEQGKSSHLSNTEAEDLAWNTCGSQAVECGRAFFERLALQWFIEDINKLKNKTAHALLGMVASLFGMWLVLRDARFCGASIISAETQDKMRREFETLLGEVRVHARCLVDGLCVPENFLGPIALVADSNDKFWSYEQTLKNSTYAGRAKL